MEPERASRPIFSDRERSHRSLFWPVLLIGVGVALLLGQLGIIEPVNWWSLVRFWPVLLIVAGLDMLFGRRSPLLGSLLGIVVVAAVLGFFAWGPGAGWVEQPDWQLGLSGLTIPTEVRHGTYSEPIGQAEAANVTLDLSSFRASVHALEGSDQLITAEVDYVGQMQFQVSGERTKQILLDETRSGIYLNLGAPVASRRWDIGLTPDLPLDLTIDSGSGSAELNLEPLDLRSLTLDGGSGSMQVALPFAEIPVRIDTGSGHCEIALPEGAQTALRLDTGSGSVVVTIGEAANPRVQVTDAGSGSLTFRLPKDSAVQLTVRDEGSGSVNVPRELTKTSGRAGKGVGTWETAGLAGERRQVIIEIDDMGSGSVSLEWSR